MWKSGLTVALDVGSQTIKGLVFECSPTEILKVHKRISVRTPPHSTAARIVEHLHAVLANVIKEFGRIPSKVTAGFGAGLADYHVEAWDVGNIGKSHLDQKDVVGYFSSLFKQHTQDDQAVIASPAGIEINGYPVSTAIFRDNAKRSLLALGGVYRDLRFRTVVAYFPSEMGTRLADMKRMLGGVPIEFVPLASAYREILVNGLAARDALLVDIGGVSTMVLLLKEGILVQDVSFPFGISHIAREVGKKLNMRQDEATDYIRQYSQGLADEKAGSLIREHLAPSLGIWTRSFREQLDVLYPFGPLTGETYLCGGGAYLPELRSYVEQGAWLKNLSYTASPRVAVLEGKSLLGEHKLGEFLQGPEDAGLASVIRYGMGHEIIV